MAKKKASRFDWGDGRKIHTRAKKNPTSKQLDDPSYVTRPKTLRDILADSETSAGLKYGGQERDLRQQGANIPPWFEAYKAQVAATGGKVQGAYNTAAGEVDARSVATQTANDTSRAQLGSQMQADAASRGATVDPNVLKDDANAATNRRLNADAFANLMTAQGNAQGAYFGGVGTAAGAAQIAAMQQNAQAYGGVQADKGLYKADYVTTARGTEHTNRLEDAAYGLKEQTAVQGVADKRAQRKATSRNLRTTIKAKQGEVNKYGYTNKDWAALTPAKRQSVMKQVAADGRAPGKGKADPALTKRREKSDTALGRLDDINARWGQYRTQNVTETITGKDGTKVDKKRKPTPSDVTNRLLGEKFTATELHLARLLREHKTFSKGDIGMAHRLGIKVPNALRPKKPGKSTPYGATAPK